MPPRFFACSSCGKEFTKESFTASQMKTPRAWRKCRACTKGHASKFVTRLLARHCPVASPGPYGSPRRHTSSSHGVLPNPGGNLRSGAG
eukprot:1994889-Prymnesium_polylepis.1